MQRLLESTLSRALRYLEDIQTRAVFPTPEAVADLVELGGTLAEEPESPEPNGVRLP